MHSRTALRTALLSAALSAAGGPVLAAPPRFLCPEGGASLDAGRSVRIAWSLGATAAPISEMELVLSLDGGRTFPVRITRELDREARSLVLTVPALPALHARLALRGGDSGEPADENILLVSEDFSIKADPDRSLEPALFVRGEWRTREALPGGENPALPDPARFDGGSPTVQPAGVRLAAGPPRPRPPGASRPIGAPSSLEGAPVEASETSPPLLPRAPADAPRRE